MSGMDERRLSPLARRRREIVADIECGLSFAGGALAMAVVWMTARLLGLC